MIDSNADNKLVEKVKSLDNTMPEMTWSQDDLWENIASDLSGKKSKGWVYASVAASVLILIVAITVIKKLDTDQVRYGYTQETVLFKDSGILDSTQEEDEALIFINESCLKAVPVCDTEEFASLKQELNELNEEIEQLDVMISKYGEGPMLVKSRIKILNHKSDVTLKLVQMLIS